MKNISFSSSVVIPRSSSDYKCVWKVEFLASRHYLTVKAIFYSFYSATSTVEGSYRGSKHYSFYSAARTVHHGSKHYTFYFAAHTVGGSYCTYGGRFLPRFQTHATYFVLVRLDFHK